MEASEYVRRKYLHEAPKGLKAMPGNAATAKFRLLWRIMLAFNIAASLALIAFAVGMLV